MLIFKQWLYCVSVVRVLKKCTDCKDYFSSFLPSLINLTLLPNTYLLKNLILIIIFVLSCCRINAQIHFTGTIYDKATNVPIPDVYVSFNGTTAYAITDNSGKFELTFSQRLNTQLVFSHIAYHTVIIENPFDDFSEKFYMEQRINTLDNVVIKANQDPFTREEKMKAFKEQFLGNTRAGRSCMIMNEDDIQLRYNAQTNTLSASSDKPIDIINEYLGYRILITLVDFKIEYSNRNIVRQTTSSVPMSINTIRPTSPPSQGRNDLQNSYVTLNRYDILQSSYSIMSFFIDLSPDNERIKGRRDEAYSRSSTFFFSNLANNTLNDNNFKIYKDRSQIDPRLYFTIKDSLSLKIIQLIPVDTRLEIRVLYKNGQSTISFYTNTLIVDQYGNIDKFDKVVFTGLMGQTRVGDILPLDYEP